MTAQREQAVAQQPNAVDIAIIGGGLAGLTLAIELKKQQPELTISVLEKQRHPLRPAAHKVGESTVELAAIYFARTLGLAEHLDREQLRKFGLRFFFRPQRGAALNDGLEIGGMQTFATPTWQIDRGIFENHLAQLATTLGVSFLHGASVREIELLPDTTPHRIGYLLDGTTRQLECRWLIDASGRAGVIKRKQNLHKAVDHNINTVWFRLAERIDIEEWCVEEDWRRFDTPSPRWLSTNHLMGQGYWVWIIPLASGSTSIGIVADPRHHPIEHFATFDKAIDWLAEHEPQCAAVVDTHRDKLQDFLRLKNFSYSCAQLFSGDRWALTGEAGVFPDPFYSPGSDYIALNNNYIADLIRRDYAGENVRQAAAIFEKLFFSFFYNSLELYRDQYCLFGNAVVMPVKFAWDFSLYWSVLAFLFTHDCCTDLAFVSHVLADFGRVETVNKRMQQKFRDWHHSREFGTPRAYLDHVSIDSLRTLNEQLHDTLPREAVLQRFRDNVAMLEALAEEIVARVERSEHVTGGRLDYLFETLGI